MNQHDQPNMTDHIVKYLAGEASPAEAMALDDWRANPDNAREYDRIRQLWYRLSHMEGLQLPATDAEWQVLQDRLSVKRTPPPQSMLHRRWLAAAAIGLLVLGAAWWGLVQYRSPASAAVHFTKEQSTVGHEIKKLALPDGSAITLHQNSTIQYVDDFGTASRQLLLQGEAYFAVTPDSTMPFTISVADLTIRVVGTAFNVREDTASGNIEVQVTLGVVRLLAANQEITVHKGQTGVYDTRRLRLYVSEVVDMNSMGYATHSFAFDDLTLREVFDYLGKAFNVQYRFEDASLGNCRLSARLEDRSLEYILQILDATLNTQSMLQGDTVVVAGEGCR